jgi:hypothetical protein
MNRMLVSFTCLSGLRSAQGETRSVLDVCSTSGLPLLSRSAYVITQGRRSAMCGRLPVGKAFLHGAAGRLRPCVRPIHAVHLTAGHNALRGSGPGQKHAFDDAMALVGCPDRRIDRLCITCCSPSQPHITPIAGVIAFTPPARRVPCSAHPWPLSPRPFWRACSPVRSPRPWPAGEPARP